MSEEEKNAINFLQKLEFDEYEWWYFGEEYKTVEETEKAFEKAQKIIIDLIEKQQKLIEECESGDVFTENQMRYLEKYIEDNYIRKAKIKDKIKELEILLNNTETATTGQEIFYKISLLKELLEEGDKDV